MQITEVQPAARRFDALKDGRARSRASRAHNGDSTDSARARTDNEGCWLDESLAAENPVPALIAQIVQYLYPSDRSA